MIHNVRKIIAAIMSAFFVLGAGIIPVQAKGETVYPDYDGDRLGSISLYKYVSNDNATVVTNGDSLANRTSGQQVALEEKTGNYRMIPEKGVEFCYLKVGDFAQTATSTDASLAIINLNTDFQTLINSYVSGALNSNEYSIDTVLDAFKAANKAAGSEGKSTGETALRELAKKKGTAFDSATNAYGKAKASDLPAGIYLVAEENWEHQTLAKHDTYWERTTGTEDAGSGSASADVASPSSPFLVQIPVPNPEGDGYLYDVTAYPKNGTINIHKDIVDEDYYDFASNNGYSSEQPRTDGLDTSETETMCDFAQTNYVSENGDDKTKLDGAQKTGLTHQIDVNTGDTVHYLISTDVPALLGDKKNKTFKITDYMSEGISFTGITKVSFGTDVWNGTNTELAKDTDYTVESGYDNSTVNGDFTTFTLTLTSAGLSKLDAITEASYLYVEYNGVLNSKAQIGTSTYDYSAHDGNAVQAGNQNTAMLTYATDRTAEHDYYSNTVKVYTYRLDMKKLLPDSVKDNDGTDYDKLSFSITAETKDGTEDLPLIEDAAGTYHVYSAPDDDSSKITSVIKPDSTGEVTINGVDAREYVITELATKGGASLLAAPLHVEPAGHKLAEEDDYYYENGSLDHAYVWTGTKPDKTGNIDIANSSAANSKVLLAEGTASFSIDDSAVARILRTGGEGSWKYLAAGISLLVLAGVLTAVFDKKSREEEGA